MREYGNIKKEIKIEKRINMKKVEERFQRVWETFGKILLETMREYKISQQRINQIVATAYQRLEEELRGTSRNERLS